METDMAVLGTESSRQWSGKVVGHFIFLFLITKSLYIALTVLELTL